MSIFKKKPRQIEYTLKLDENAEKFIELMSLSYDDRRKRALELLGGDWFDTLIFSGSHYGGLSGGIIGLKYNDDEEDHISKLLKMAMPDKEKVKLTIDKTKSTNAPGIFGISDR